MESKPKRAKLPQQYRDGAGKLPPTETRSRIVKQSENVQDRELSAPTLGPHHTYSPDDVQSEANYTILYCILLYCSSNHNSNDDNGQLLFSSLFASGAYLIVLFAS
jgi:hypothetical protein